MANRNIHALFTAGRVVLLQHPASGLIELAAVLGSPDTLDSMLAAADSGLGGKGSFGGKAPKKGGINMLSGSSGSSTGAGSSGSGPDRMLWLLVLHSSGPMDPLAAESTAAEAAAAAAQISRWQWSACIQTMC